ncbi:MAG TPA: G/U mismatch-specific DNA glycosylase [Steroidobacteraceae bacterium]|jgi:TDG/mug DNA glycosylase family protein
MGAGLSDILAANLSVLFCGLNPGVRAAAAGHHFVGRGNRFWRVLHLAGFTPTQIDPMRDTSILSFGYGLTAVVARPTASADEVSYEEIIAGRRALRRKIERYSPRYVAFLGKAAYAPIGGQHKAFWGRQPETIAAAVAWILPNPSGRNRGFSLAALVEAYGQLRRELDETLAVAR